MFSSCSIPSSDLWAVSTQEANLCAKSCLRILKTVSSSCKFNLLLECLHSMAMWVAILEKVPSLEADDAMRFKESENMVKETIDAVKKWLKKSLLVQIPCYTTADTNKELQVCFLAVTYQCCSVLLLKLHASIAEVSVHFGIVSNEHKAGHICLRLDRAKSRCAAKGIFFLFLYFPIFFLFRTLFFRCSVRNQA